MNIKPIQGFSSFEGMQRAHRTINIASARIARGGLTPKNMIDAHIVGPKLFKLNAHVFKTQQGLIGQFLNEYR